LRVPGFECAPPAMAPFRLVVAALAACSCIGSVAGRCWESSSRSIKGPFVPHRQDVSVADGWQEALRLLMRDGAVVLTGLVDSAAEEDFRALAGSLPARLFDGTSGQGVRLLSPNAPVNGVHEELREAKRRGLYEPGSGLEPHTDGYVYGDDLPDFVFLLCERASARGGANVLLDGVALLDAVEAGDPADRGLAAWLNSTSVDLSEGGDTGITVGRAAEGPIVQWHTTASGRSRLKWRRQVNVGLTKQLATWKPLAEESAEDVAARRCSEVASPSYLSLWRPLPSTTGAGATSEVESKLRDFDAWIQQASAVAFSEQSFSLSRGEALVVDNYRVLHGRAPYAPPRDEQAGGGDASADAQNDERRFWRVWSWTSEGTGVPPDGALSSNPLNDEVFGDKQGAPSRTDL